MVSRGFFGIYFGMLGLSLSLRGGEVKEEGEEREVGRELVGEGLGASER